MATLTTPIFPGGERCPMLLDEQGIPLFFPALFVTTQLRNAGAAVNTIRNKLNDLRVLFMWEQAHGRDLVEQFRRAAFLTLPDIVALRDFAATNMKLAKASKRVKSPTSSQRHGVLEAFISRTDAAAIVTKQQQYNRISTFAEYLEFVAYTVNQRRNDPAINAEIAQMVKRLKKHRPKGVRSASDDDALAKSPPSELVDRFMAVSQTNDPDNPFKNPGVRLRNTLLLGILRYTGMRRGELLSLRIDQLVLGHAARVHIRRNQDDPFDPRPNQPVTKTKERLIPLPDSLSVQIQDYILNVRATIGPARKHPYLFVSHQKGKTYGRPLSISALSSQIFPAMRAVDPSFARIHPHSFRHHFNFEISKIIDRRNATARSSSAELKEEPISPAQESDIRAYLNGHHSRKSSEVYTKRHTRESADKAARQLQSELMDGKYDATDCD